MVRAYGLFALGARNRLELLCAVGGSDLEEAARKLGGQASVESTIGGEKGLSIGQYQLCISHLPTGERPEWAVLLLAERDLNQLPSLISRAAGESPHVALNILNSIQEPGIRLILCSVPFIP
jgi:hypothetical protein